MANWREDVIKELIVDYGKLKDIQKTIIRTLHYIDEQGVSVSDDVRKHITQASELMFDEQDLVRNRLNLLRKALEEGVQ